MNALRSFSTEVAGLFIEDRYFAVAIALWLAFVFAVFATHVAPPRAGGALLFGGLAAILIASVARAARGSHS